MSGRMPALFIGHGNPMNAMLANPYTQRWAGIGATLPRPKAILSVSAHWYIEDAAVTVSTAPRMIHDFGGFPRELYQLQYPAPGDPDLAVRVQKLLSPTPVRRDDRWGLDHGTWSNDTSSISDQKASCEFSAITPGTYAISVFHDENSNGKLDTNFLGIPREGVGASNDARGHMGPPKFGAAAFHFSGDRLNLKITVNYL